MADEIQKAHQMHAEAEAKFNEYRFRLERLDKELTSVLDDVREGTKIEVQRILEDAERVAGRIAADEKTRLEQEAKKIRDNLARHAAEVALELAEIQVRTRLEKDGKQDQLVDRIVTELEQRDAEVQA